jgi:mevalonate kinase
MVRDFLFEHFLIMNSQTLKQKFPKIYQEFFSKCQRVVSSPHSFFWTGDFSGFYGGLTISQKIPLRFYVGLEEINPIRFEIQRKILAFVPYRRNFVEIQLDDYLFEKLNSLLSKYLKGSKIYFLSEIPLGSSLGGLGAISACLAMLITTKNLEKIFLLAWQIVKELQQGRSSGATAFASLSNSPYPIVFYSKGKKYWGGPLDQFYSLPPMPSWPIDFGLIFSGNFVQGASVIASALEIKNILEKRESQIKKILKTDFKNSFWKTYLLMLNQTACQNLIALAELFKKGANDSALEFFFNTLNQYQNLLHFLEISTPSIDKIYSEIHQIANKTENKVGSGAKITGVGKGGEVLFALPFGQYREKISNLKSQISNLSLDYASWQDGFETEGVKIEQDLQNGIYSSFIEKGSLLLKIYQGDKVSSKIIKEEDLEKEKRKIELLFDTINNKIYIKGRGFDSSSLPSQKATIEILQKLLRAKGKKLKNTELPKSYAENRYDLQSKITAPLSRLVPLRFEISGGMYENYNLTLKPFDIRIGILGKLVL